MWAAEMCTDVAQVRCKRLQLSYMSLYSGPKQCSLLQDQGIRYVAECGPGNVLANLAKRLPNIEKAFPLDSKSRLEDALDAILVAEGKIA